MQGHLARWALAYLSGSVLLGSGAHAQGQAFPFPNQGVSFSATLDNPEAGSPTGFGDAVGIEGLTVLAGIPFYGPNNAYGFPTGQGRVAVFTADAATGEVWTRTGSIENPNPLEGGGFGQALAIQHHRAIVEALDHLYVFDEKGMGAAESWDLRATIALPAPVTNSPPPVIATEFDYGPLAYDDGVVATTVTRNLDVNGDWQSAAFVYLYEVGWDGHTRLLDKLVPPDGAAGTTVLPNGQVGCVFGASLALDAGTLVVGCPAGTGPVTQPYPLSTRAEVITGSCNKRSLAPPLWAPNSGRPWRSIRTSFWWAHRRKMSMSTPITTYWAPGPDTCTYAREAQSVTPGL